MSKISTLFFSLIIIFSTIAGIAVALPPHTVTVYTKRTAETGGHMFSPAEKIQVALELQKVPKGTHEVTIDWISPSSKLIQNDSHSFTLETEAAAYQVRFWLKLHARGPFNQMFTGSEYSKGVYGKWSVQLFWNGQMLTDGEFEIAPH